MSKYEWPMKEEENFDLWKELLMPPRLFEERFMYHMKKKLEEGTRSEMRKMMIEQTTAVPQTNENEKPKDVEKEKSNNDENEKSNDDEYEKSNNDKIMKSEEEKEEVGLDGSFEELNEMLKVNRLKKAERIRIENEEKIEKEKQERFEIEKIEKEIEAKMITKSQEEKKKENEKTVQLKEEKNEEIEWTKEEIELMRRQNLANMMKKKEEEKEIYADDGEWIDPFDEPAGFSSQRCWNCLKMKHKYTECPMPLRRFCRGCGKWGVTLRECDDCGEGWKTGLRPTAKRF